MGDLSIGCHLLAFIIVVFNGSLQWAEEYGSCAHLKAWIRNRHHYQNPEHRVYAPCAAPRPNSSHPPPVPYKHQNLTFRQVFCFGGKTLGHLTVYLRVQDNFTFLYLQSVIPLFTTKHTRNKKRRCLEMSQRQCCGCWTAARRHAQTFGGRQACTAWTGSAWYSRRSWGRKSISSDSEWRTCSSTLRYGVMSRRRVGW